VHQQILSAMFSIPENKSSLSSCSTIQLIHTAQEFIMQAVISGPEPIAVEAGAQVLRRGGNAIDAAVT
jgi:gamma-glutamyltranspeptidase